MNRTKIEQPESVSGAFEELLNKMYISNVQNRLRQLNEPTDNDCKRWVWELIQNAKDSISNDKSRNSVDVKIVIKDKEVKFSHNGSPFTANAQLGLLYKYSDGKVNNNESTGRFGTGFLTTHTLSKIVGIEGDVYTNDNNDNLCGFSATMYRDGLDEQELLEGIKKMKKSMVYTQETNNCTSFTYQLKTIQNEKALRLGVENFMTNITQTMLFCKELSSIELDNNGVVTKIIRNECRLLDNEIYISEFKIIGETNYIRNFVHKSLEKHNNELTKRFKKDRNIRITAAIEVGRNHDIIDNKDSPSHFCILPLVGSEKHLMPIYINSPDFEPDSERESLILIGDDILADKDVISDGGINRLILKESIQLYDSLVKYLSEKKYVDLFLLAKGVKRTPKVEKNFDHEWFDKEIISSYREILGNVDIVETEINNQKLFKEDNIPNIIIPKDKNLENQTKLYALLKEIFPGKLPIVKIANDWAELAWKECGLFKTEDLCKFIAEKKSVQNLELPGNKYDWLNNFLFFIKETDESLFKKFAIIPNRKGDFVSLENDKFAEGVGLTDYMIDVLDELDDDLTPNLLNDEITVINIPLKIDRNNIADRINKRGFSIVENKELSDEQIINGLLPLLNTTPTDGRLYSIEFINKQKQIQFFLKNLFPHLQIQEEVNNDIPERAWEATHTWLIIKLIETVSNFNNVESLPVTIENKIVWINNFIAFISKEIKEGQLDIYAIIPNQNDNFCFKKDLSKDIHIPDELKSKNAEKFGVKIKDTLLHKSIDSIDITKEKNISTVTEIINFIFKNNQFEEGYSDLDFAIFLIHLLPESTQSVIYSSQKKLLELVKAYDHKTSDLNTQSRIFCNNEELWQKANDVIIRSYIKRLEEDGSIDGLKNYLSEESGKSYDNRDTVIFLNNFYDYLKSSNRSISGKIIPNQNGDFCSLDDELYKDDNIPDDLKYILNLINQKDNFKNILADTSLSMQPSHSKKIEDIAKAIDDTIKEIYSNNNNWDNKEFKSAIQLLMINWFPAHKDQQNKDYFPYTFGKKETIEMNVLWSLEERQRMQKAKSIDSKLLDKFIDSNGEIELLEIKRNVLEAKIAELEKLTLNGLSDEIIARFPDITVDRIYELLKLEERIRGWNVESDYQTSEEEIRRNRENSYKGEAYIYSQLIKSDHFKNVIWEQKSVEPTELTIIDYENNSHYIKKNYNDYDLIAETHEGNRIYIEVKSTRTSIQEVDRIAIPISSREWKFVNQISINDKYCLARVFDVENEPQGYYLSIMGNGLGTNVFL